jgi:sodium-dependent dicarboxylate transporter 2/3/5
MELAGMTEPEQGRGGSDAGDGGVLSPGEEKIEKWRRGVGLFLGPAVALALFFLPMPLLGDKAHRLAAVLGWVVTWWVTEPVPIPVTAVIGAMLCIPLGVAPAKTVFAPFADPIIYLFMGSFILARAMSLHGLDRRLAFGILSLPWVGGRTWRIFFVFGLITCLLSSWLSNSATTAMMFPIGLGIVGAMADMMSRQSGETVDLRRLKYATGMMLMAAYASSVGGIGTPVGTPPNLIAIAMLDRLAGVRIPFFQWMALAIPIMAAMFVVLWVLMYRLHKPRITSVGGSEEFVKGERDKLGRWKTGEINTLLAFFVTVILWIIPGFLALIFGTDAAVSKRYGEIVPEPAAALIGAGLLFVLPVRWREREFTMTWRQAVRIDWGTLLLFGGGLSLGSLMFELKVADALGTSLLHLSGATSLWGITLVSIVIAVLATEVTSNTAAANMIIPTVIALSAAAKVNPVPPAVGAAIGASLAFMLPVSTPPNAIVYGSGMVPVTRMITVGVLFDVLAILLTWAGLRIMLPLVGLA